MWDHAVELASFIRSHLALDIYRLDGQVPETKMLGQTADISFISAFGWYDWIYYNESIVGFPEPKMQLGRYLGPTDPEAGSVLTAKVLTRTGEIVRRNTFRHLTDTELESKQVQDEQVGFDDNVRKRLGEAFSDEKDLSSSLNISSVSNHDFNVFDEDDLQGTELSEDQASSSEPEVMDKYITAQVLLPRNDELKLGKVIERSVDEHGVPIGRSNNNPILDSREYRVEFDDGEVLDYAANVIAENLYSQVDSEGRRYLLMDSIIDHKSDKNAVAKDDEFVVVNGKRHKKKTTEGWSFNIQWKD